MGQALTDEQVKEVAQALEELGYTDDQIDVALGLLQKVESNKEALSLEGDSASVRARIKAQIAAEKDWRKRASLAALLISNDL